MVKGKRKPLKQIQDSIKDYNKVLTVGCGGCVSICLAGGQKEVIALNTELNVTFKLEKIQTPCSRIFDFRSANQIRRTKRRRHPSDVPGNIVTNS